MGDRANIEVVDNFTGKSVFLYTHWTGTELPETLRAALKRGGSRWYDAAYLTRIIFSEMIKNDIEGETGYGISSEVGDGGDRVLIVDPALQQIRVTNEFGSDDYGDWPAHESVYTFEGFLEGTPVTPVSVGHECKCNCGKGGGTE